MVNEVKSILNDKEFPIYFDRLEREKKDNIHKGIACGDWPTWIFDQIGRRAPEEDLDDYLYRDVKEMLRRREVMKQVLITSFGNKIGNKIYTDWYNGNHDT